MTLFVNGEYLFRNASIALWADWIQKVRPGVSSSFASVQIIHVQLLPPVGVLNEAELVHSPCLDLLVVLRGPLEKVTATSYSLTYRIEDNMKYEDAVALVGDDYSPSPGMVANVILRLVLNLGSALACWIPMRLFHRNGELAGAAMVIATAIMNFYYGVNSVIWPDNNIEGWFKGYGWCDIQLVVWVPLETMNAAAICAVMQNIANKVSLVRASGLMGHEKRRKHLIQALIIFPVPALQALLYYFTISMRYNISGVVGCQAVFQNNWVFLVFFLLPCPIFAVAAAYFAGECSTSEISSKDN